MTMSTYEISTYDASGASVEPMHRARIVSLVYGIVLATLGFGLVSIAAVVPAVAHAVP